MKVKQRQFDALVRAGTLEIGDGYRAKNAELGGDGLIFLRSAYLQDHGFVLSNPDRFQSTDVSTFGPKVSSLNDVVITTKGNSTGRVGRIRSEQVGAVYSPHLSYWRSKAPDEIDQLFLYYWSLGTEFRAQLAGMAYSTDMAPYLSLRDQLRLEISLPGIEHQRAASSILSALDDKIELNRQMNETLEQQARAIFKDWFVDFGPTRAKMEGREPYLAADLWNLFPARLDDEGRPEGWVEVTLSFLARLNAISWTASEHPEEVDYVDLSNTKWGTIESTARYAWKDAPSRAKRVLRTGDTIVGTVRPGNGSYSYVGNEGLTGSTGFAVLTPKQPHYRELLYFGATSPENIERLSHLADGGAYPAVRPEIVADTKLAWSGDKIALAYSNVTRRLLDKMEAIKNESRTLSETRDLLLPKLMSGEIRVRDAETVVGEAI